MGQPLFERVDALVAQRSAAWVVQFGRAPAEVWIDNSSSATRRMPAGQHGRQFTAEFEAVCKHFGMQPHAINVEAPNENGNVESLHGHLKKRVEQYLLVRGSRDFERGEDYDAFLRQMFRKANARVSAKVAQELELMHELPPTVLTDYQELDCRVSSGSTIRVRHVVYSVPSRLCTSYCNAQASHNSGKEWFSPLSSEGKLIFPKS